MLVRRKQRGIGLLELMLSLSIIAILLVMATRYYDNASYSNKINNGISQVNAIAAAMYNYKNVHGNYTATIQDLINDGWLPTTFSAANANPWGGSLAVSSPGNGFTVQVNAIPNQSSGGTGACSAMKALINNNTNNYGNTNGNADCSGSSPATLTVDFN